MQRWAGIWAKGNASDVTTELWTAAAVTPLDCGQEKPEPDEAPDLEARKLRPIALAKELAEGLLLHDVDLLVERNCGVCRRESHPTAVNKFTACRAARSSG